LVQKEEGVMRARTVRRGFTLIELLVATAIFGVLAGLLLSAVQKVRGAAQRLVCANNLRQMGLACHQYHDVHGSFPSGYIASGSSGDTSPGWGWAAQLLPFIEQTNVHNQIKFDQPIQDAQNKAAVQTRIKLFICPADIVPPAGFAVGDGFSSPIVTAAPSSYAACCGGDETATDDPTGLGIFYRNSQTRIDEITDGASNTLLIGERAWSNVQGTWVGAIPGAVCMRGKYNPCPGSGAGSYPAATLVLAHSHLNNTNTDTDGGLDDFSSNHSGGSNFVFADGSVRFLRSVPGDVAGGGYAPESLSFQAMGTRANGDVIQIPLSK
jgi:prepilin-type N-terminal cleavage/methylation domain-containing protein/prepilin-type processing-associated H-X9-DG protein